ncbi:MAG: RNA-binding domain-containing protein [Desulfurococcaceae archaeon]
MASRNEAERRKVDASYLEAAALCHATEECSRVEESVRRIFPPELREAVELETAHMDGYYGNPISVITARLNNSEQVHLTLKHVSEALDPLEKAILRTTFDMRYDHKSKKLVVRFSKQDLYLGKLKIHDSDDVVKVIIGLKNARSASDAINFFSLCGLLS